MTSRHDRQNRLPGLPVRKLLLAGIVLVALIVSLTAYETFSRRDRAYAAVERDLNLLATAMSGYTARTFQSLELMLRNIEADLDDLKLDRSADMAEATRILRQRQSDFPMLASLNLLGSEGELLAAAIPIPAPRPHYGDRDYFREAKARSESKRIYIGRPIFGRKSQRWAIPVILNRHDAQGRFIGAIYAGVDIEKLTDYYQSISRIDGAVTTLYRADARLLARAPAQTEAYDKDYADIDVFRARQLQAADGFYHGRDPADGTPRSVAYRSIDEFGLLLNVSANEELIESGWRQTLALPLATALAGLLLCLTLLAIAWRQWRNHRELQSRFAWQANHDAATGLPNRFLFEDRLQKALHAAQRSRTPLALMFIDLDNFKRINDSLGHAAGDQVLRTAAVWLRTCVRESDTVARLGGDEFAILLPELAAESDVGVVAGKILQQFNTPMHIGEQALTITASIGIATFPRDGSDAAQMMVSADAAMYQAKEGGRNLVCHFSQTLADAISRRLQIETRLQDALERDEFSLVFQPVVDAGSGLPVAAEALLRWHSAELGPVPPDEFIPVAESIGLIPAIGDYVLREACRQAASWPAVAGQQLRLSVNVSARQLEQAGFRQRVSQTLEQCGLPPTRLALEITESLLVTPDSAACKQLRALRELGIGVAIDDFGTGYSSLSYLSRFPFNSLKIDRAFVARIEGSAADRILVRAIVALAHGLGLHAVGEGVENDNQRLLLSESGCRWLQGYLFSRPLPAAQFADWLAARNTAQNAAADAPRVTG